MAECNKDCTKCKHLSGRTDDKGYPYEYECLKYGDSAFKEKFGNTKEFKEMKMNKEDKIDEICTCL